MKVRGRTVALRRAFELLVDVAVSTELRKGPPKLNHDLAATQAMTGPNQLNESLRCPQGIGDLSSSLFPAELFERLHGEDGCEQTVRSQDQSVPGVDFGPNHVHSVRMVGDVIRKLRRDMGLSQRELGRRAGVSGRYIGHLEQGRREGKRDTLEAIAQALEVTYVDLVSEGTSTPLPVPQVPIDGEMRADGTVSSDLVAMKAAAAVTPGGLVLTRGDFRPWDTIPIPLAKDSWYALTHTRGDVDVEWAKLRLQDGDVLVFDGDLEPTHGKLVIAGWEGDVDVKVRVWRELDGDQLLWPLRLDADTVDRADNPNIAIVGVGVGLWRAL